MTDRAPTRNLFEPAENVRFALNPKQVVSIRIERRSSPWRGATARLIVELVNGEPLIIDYDSPEAAESAYDQFVATLDSYLT